MGGIPATEIERARAQGFERTRWEAAASFRVALAANAANGSPQLEGALKNFLILKIAFKYEPRQAKALLASVARDLQGQGIKMDAMGKAYNCLMLRLRK
jgi:hypothetical protein